MRRTIDVLVLIVLAGIIGLEGYEVARINHETALMAQQAQGVTITLDANTP